MDLIEDPKAGSRQLPFQDPFAMLGIVPIEVARVAIRQAAGQRFLALDLDLHGYLTLPDLQRIRPAPPPEPNRNDAPSAPPPDSSDGAVVPGNY